MAPALFVCFKVTRDAETWWRAILGMLMLFIGSVDALFKSMNCAAYLSLCAQPQLLTRRLRDEGVSVLLQALGTLPSLNDAWSKFAAV